MMRSLLLALLLSALTGCSSMTDQSQWLEPVDPTQPASLHRIHIEQSGVTRFVGLLALEPRAEGIWTILLDATGIALIKGLVSADGTMQIDYSVSAKNTKRLPELLGRIISYTYLIPASVDCPWYDPYRVCIHRDDSEQSVKWRKAGPFRLWEVEKQHDKDRKETITVNLNIQSVRVTLQDLAEERGN